MAHFFTKLIALSSGQRHPPFDQLGPGYFLLNIYMMSESRDYFTLVLNVGTKNTHTHHISFFSEPHYIGQEANNISTHIHDQLRQQQCPSRVSFGKEVKKKIMRYLDKIHPGWYYSCIQGISIIRGLQVHSFLVLFHTLFFLVVTCN